MKNAIDINIHSPDSLSRILSNTLHSSLDRTLFDIRGIYSDRRGKLYGDVYYDQLVDIVANKNLTLRVPKSIKHLLFDNGHYTFRGYINHTIPSRQDIGISLNFHIHKILNDQGIFKRSNFEMATLIEKKSEAGFQNVEKYIFTRFSKSYKVLINVIVGNNAITDNDFIKAIGDGLKNYEISEYRINLNSVDEITSKINKIDREAEGIIALIRGGGDLSIFNEIEVVQSAISLNNVFVTAIGHASDNCTLNKVADQNFETPSSLGAFFKDCASQYRFKSGELTQRDKNKLKLTETNETLKKENIDLICKLNKKDETLDSISSSIMGIDKSASLTTATLRNMNIYFGIKKVLFGFVLGVVLTKYFPEIILFINQSKS